MSWRKAHGNAARSGRLVVLEGAISDELPAATPELPARSDRDPAGRFLPGNRWAKLARSKAGPNGALAALDAKAAPEWRAARRWAQRAAGHRIREFTRLHGGDLSAGVCMLLVDGADLRGDARYLQARARAEDNAELLRVASQLLTSARQAERDAWELASREAASRRASAPAAAPWLTAAPKPADGGRA